MKIKFKYLSACSLVAAASASAATLVIPVTQDGWIGAGSEAGFAQDGGVGTQLNVATPNPAGAAQYTRKAWFGFDTTALAALGNVNICSATLTFNTGLNIDASYNGNNAMRFYAVTNENPGSIDTTALEDKFDEALLTWDNAPGNIAGNVLTADRVNGVILGDVPMPNPAANAVMSLSGFGNSPLAEFLKQPNTNNFITIAATYLGQNNAGFGAFTGASFRSREDTGFGAVLTIEYTASACPVVITSQPKLTPTGTIYNGQPFSLSVSAVGTPDLYYQWRKGGQPVSGATDATYAKAESLVSDSGIWDVVITNAANAVTSAPVAVTITPLFQPQITKAPVSQDLYATYPVTFSVAAVGGELVYFWKKDTTVLAAGPNASFTIPSLSQADAGTYSVIVSNSVGTVEASANLTVKVAAAGTYEEAVVKTRPLVWFRANETPALVDNTGTAANSGSVGATGNGVARRYVAFQQPGALAGDSNKSAELNSLRTGNDGRMIDVPFNAALNPNSFTAELWVKPAERIGTSARSPLYNRGTGAGDGFLFFAHNGNTKWQFRTYAGTTARNVNSTNDVVPGVWTHLVGVYDASTGTQQLYVNGVEQGTANFPGFTPNAGEKLRFGARNDIEFGANLLLFKGNIDEVAIYPTALTAAQILENYQNATNAARTTPYETLVLAKNPVGYWRFNDAAGAEAPVVINGGTLGSEWNGGYGFNPQTGTVGPRTPAQPGFEANNVALTLDSTYGHIGAPICPALNTNTVTVTGWLKREGAPSNADVGWPVWFGDGGMHIENTGGRPQGELRYHWKGGQWGWSSGLVVPDGVWTFVAMVVEPTRAVFYMSDGTTLRSSTNTVAHAALSVTSPLGFAGNQADRADRNYLGQHDEFAVYNRALSLSEINTLFMQGTGAKIDLALVPGGTIRDTKPQGTPHPGLNSKSTWVASSTDGLNVTRQGVQVFATANPSQIVVPANPDFDSPSGTITFWMRANAPVPGPGNEAAILFDRRTSTGAIIGLNDAGSIYWQGQAGARNALTGGYVPDLNWHHVAVTYGQTTSDSISIYIDGLLNASTPVTNGWSWPTTQQIEIGRSHDGYWKRYDGELDDFRIYNRVLTDAEIAQVHSSGAVVDPGALKLRFNFDDAGTGNSLVWPFGTLQSSPSLGPDANWTPVPGANSPYPFLTTEPSLFFRAVP